MHWIQMSNKKKKTALNLRTTSNKLQIFKHNLHNNIWHVNSISWGKCKKYTKCLRENYRSRDIKRAAVRFFNFFSTFLISFIYILHLCCFVSFVIISSRAKQVILVALVFIFFSHFVQTVIFLDGLIVLVIVIIVQLSISDAICRNFSLFFWLFQLSFTS